jgi:hypothetical protein
MESTHFLFIFTSRNELIGEFKADFIDLIGNPLIAILEPLMPYPTGLLVATFVGFKLLVNLIEYIEHRKPQQTQ